MNDLRVCAYLLTASAHRCLGSRLEQAFDWHLPANSPLLRRLQVSTDVKAELAPWAQACEALDIAPVLVLGPGDPLPDLSADLGSTELSVCAVDEKFDEPDIAAIVENLRQPDLGVVLDEWREFVGGVRYEMNLLHLGQESLSFWRAYGDAFDGWLTQPEGTAWLSGLPSWSGEAVDPGFFSHWADTGGDIHEFRFAAFPMWGLRLFAAEDRWAPFGLCPHPDTIDPDGRVRALRLHWDERLRSISALLRAYDDLTEQANRQEEPTLQGDARPDERQAYEAEMISADGRFAIRFLLLPEGPEEVNVEILDDRPEAGDSSNVIVRFPGGALLAAGPPDVQTSPTADLRVESVPSLFLGRRRWLFTIPAANLKLILGAEAIGNSIAVTFVEKP